MEEVGLNHCYAPIRGVECFKRSGYVLIELLCNKGTGELPEKSVCE